MSVKRSVSVAALAAVSMVIAGCQTAASAGNPAVVAPGGTPALVSGNSGVIRADVTDIRPAEMSTATPAGLVMTPMYDSPTQPVTYAAAAPATVAIPGASVKPMLSNSAVASSGTTHAVKARETLFSIARSSYGDGKQWRKIALANPGLSPSSLHIGQVITIP